MTTLTQNTTLTPHPIGRPAAAGPPLLLTRDSALAEEVTRLAAAADTHVDVVTDVVAVVRVWARASVVLVGADLAAEIVPLGLPRRDAVHVLCLHGVPDHVFKTALAIGASDVSELPRSTDWLAELLTELDELPHGRGRLIGVVGGSGGAGASTFAAALGQSAARHAPTLVVDADPLGAGLARVLGLERRSGVHWSDLGRTTGRLSARSLREAVPRRGGLGVLSFSAGEPAALTTATVREVLSAAVRGHRYVVVDLPRAPSGASDEIAARCDVLLVMVTPTVAGVASASRWCQRSPDRSRLRLVVRGDGVAAESVARATGVAVVATMNHQRGVDESIDLGLGPIRSRRGPLGRATTEVWRAIDDVAS